MAKIIMEQKLKAAGLDKRIIVDSAAYGEPSSTTAHPAARQVIMELYRADLLAGHVPKKLTGAMAGEANLILVMEEYMAAGLPAEKVKMLDIPDPFAAGIGEYRVSAGSIVKSVAALQQVIEGILSSLQQPKT